MAKSQSKSKALAHFRSKKLSIEERLAAGKALRTAVPRISMGDYIPAKKRPNPVDILEKQSRRRIQELIPIRYSRMLASPFAFLRGAASIMASDLASGGKTTGISVQACGDMHVSNFGVFASAERKLIFGINDFDETLPGPWEWDLKRLCASIICVGRFIGADKQQCKEAVMRAVATYRKKMRSFASMGNLELWYTALDQNVILQSLDPSAQKKFKKILSSAEGRTHLQVLDKLTNLVDEAYHLQISPPIIMRPTHTTTGMPVEEALGIFLESYLKSLPQDRRDLLHRYRIVDAVRKIVGVGSVGTRCWVILLIGNHQDDPLFLQLKEAETSVLEPYLGKSVFANTGQRVVEGQRKIQGAPDIFLGWGQIEQAQFYIRQLRDMKGGVEFVPDESEGKYLPDYSCLCAWALALAHARSGDAALIGGYVGKTDELDEAMYRFALAYADQTEKDHQELAAAAKSKRIKVAKAGS